MLMMLVVYLLDFQQNPFILWLVAFVLATISHRLDIHCQIYTIKSKIIQLKESNKTLLAIHKMTHWYY